VAVKIDKKIVKASVVKEKDSDYDDLTDDLTDDIFDDDIPDCDNCDHRAMAIAGYGQNVKRPEVLPAAVYKIKDPTKETNIYCSISNMGGKPFEIFINSRHTGSQQWVSAMTVLISAMFRAGIPAEFIGKELEQIVDSSPYNFKGKFGCTVAHIGRVILQHCNDDDSDLSVLVEKTENIISDAQPVTFNSNKIATCEKCGGDMVSMDNCPTCLDCGNSKCG